MALVVVVRPVWGVQVGQAAQGAAAVSNQVEVVTPTVGAAVQVVAACKRGDPVGLLWPRIVWYNLVPNPLALALFSFFLSLDSVLSALKFVRRTKSRLQNLVMQRFCVSWCGAV